MATSFVTSVVDPLGPEGAVASALARNVEPFETRVVGYDTVLLDWTSPALGAWLGIQVVRSRSGYPRTPDDGVSVLLFEQPGWNEQSTFTVSGLTGGYHYFSLFLRDAFGWHRVSTEYALVPYDYSSTDRMWDTIPEYYREIRDDTADLSMVNLRINPDLYDGVSGGSAPNLLLSAFISLFGWGFDLLRTQAEYLMQGYDPSVIHVSRLALLAQQFGHNLEEAVPSHVNRTVVRNLATMYRNRGTLEGIRDSITTLSGWDVEVTLGYNMLLSEDQSAHINPDQGSDWDSTVRYGVGSIVRYGDYTYEAQLVNLATPPPSSATSNATWLYSVYPRARTGSRVDTGDVNTWQVRLNGVGDVTTPVAGLTKQTVGAPDITGTKMHKTALRVHRPVGTLGDTWLEVVSVPVLSTPTKDAREHILDSGIPIPRPVKWDTARVYRAGEFALYKGAAYEALNEVVGVLPTATTDWLRVGVDDRVMFTASMYAHGPFEGTAGTGGKVVVPKVYAYSAAGVTSVEQTLEYTSASSAVAPFYDPFVDDTTSITTLRQITTGQNWASDSVGTWVIDRDDNGGWADPPATGKSHRWHPVPYSAARIGVTFTSDPGTSRLVGIIFRRSDTNNYWIATQTGLYKVVAGAARANPASGAFTWTKFTTGQRLQVFPDGNNITVYRDGVSLGTAVDSFNAANTNHGLGAEV